MSLELASTKQELQRAQREREGERAVLVELRRIEEDREEECQFERSERKRIEEQKKLVDLALQEYGALVKRLDPSAVPPALPKRATDNVLQQPPELSAAAADDDAPAVPPKEEAVDAVDALEEISLSSPISPKVDQTLDLPPSTNSKEPDSITTSSEAISNLLIGQRGVHRLFRDFTSALSSKDKEIHSLQAKREELEHALSVLREQLEAETTARVDAQADRDRALRDDASAAKVVERYMTFSQKAHQTVHMHLGQQRQRAASTQASLRAEGASFRHRMRSEADRSARLRAACEEMADELGRESAGRRREVALRLGMIAADEARAQRTESWLDRVRRAREQADGPAPDWPALVDEAQGILAPTEKRDQAKAPGGSGFRARFLRRKSVSKPAATPPTASTEDQSLARIFLAEELVQHLVTDLQIETERRIDLEQQRVAWLAKEAEDGVPAASGELGGLVFDVEDEDDDKKEDAEVKGDDTDKVTTADAPEPPTSPPPPPEMEDLTILFEALESRYKPLQKSLHDQAHALKSLRASLPAAPGSSNGATSTSTPTSTSGTKRAALGRALALRPARTAHDDLVSILDGLHEVIEDARVDAEIAVADEDRQFHGFAALLGVGANGVVQASSVLRDARAYADARSGDDTPFARLNARVEDIENDLALIKRTLHEAHGLDEPEEETPAPGTKKARKKSPWIDIPLRTVSPAPGGNRTSTPQPSLLAAALVEDDTDDDMPKLTAPRPSIFSSVGQVGRSFSSGVVGAASGVAGAPRRVSDLAGGLYRPKPRATPEEQPLAEERHGDEDVE